ncbi:hypothetical protein [Elioraea sp.]|uniref:hypothetical protein n=1 Tax=Elioraea sp. TaxID=2185103 RepID=UPI0025C72F99|nr:hypothetical protein [Elioraea sp.]
MRRRLLLVGALGLAACDGGMPVENVTLPLGALRGAGDALWQATELASHALAIRPAALAGNPAEAALAVLYYEYAAAESGNGRLSDQNPARLMREGRPHLRAAAGIIGEATPQAVIDALWAVSEALRRGDDAAARAAFAGPVFRQPPEVPRDALSRLAVPQQAVRGLRELRALLERERGPMR